MTIACLGRSRCRRYGQPSSDSNQHSSGTSISIAGLVPSRPNSCSIRGYRGQSTPADSFRSPFPEFRQRRHLISEIENISSQHQHIADNRQFIMFQISVVLLELHVQITHVLYLHLTVLLSLIVQSVSL